jgi:hypothetical protein
MVQNFVQFELSTGSCNKTINFSTQNLENVASVLVTHNRIKGKERAFTFMESEDDDGSNKARSSMCSSSKSWNGKC